VHPEAIEWVGNRAARTKESSLFGDLAEGLLVVLVTGVTHRDRV
jgi:hypothetical protein